MYPLAKKTVINSIHATYLEAQLSYLSKQKYARK